MSVSSYIINGFTIVCFMAIYVYVTSIVGNLILGTATGRFPFQRGMKTRASLTDVYVLVAQLGLSGVILSENWLRFAYLSIAREDMIYAILIIWPQLLLCWFLGLRALTRTRVTNTAKRIFFLLILAPSAFGGIYFFSAYCLFHTGQTVFEDTLEVIAGMVAFSWLCGCAFVSRRIVDDYRNFQPPAVDSSHEQNG